MPRPSRPRPRRAARWRGRPTAPRRSGFELSGEAHDVWEYYPARQQSPWDGGVIEIGGQRVEYAACRLSVEPDEHRPLLHVGVFHPAFGDMENGGAKIALFVMLDQVLGEEGVERWLGAIDVADEQPPDAVDFGGLLAAVEEQRERGTDLWGTGQGVMDGAPVVFMANLGVKRIDQLLFDVYTRVHLEYGAVGHEGLPDGDTLELIGEATDVLEERLGREALTLGASSHQGLRTIHLRTANQGRALSIIEAWAADEGRWPITVEQNLDPTWEQHPPFLA